MILVAGGDSFVYGSELEDGVTPFNPLGTEDATPQVSLSTYPALLAKEYNLEYYCTAFPGFSNSSIRRTTMNACEKLDNIGLVFITWSFMCRYEFRFRYDIDGTPWYNISPWTVESSPAQIKESFKNHNDRTLHHHITHLNYIKDLGVSDFAESFYKHVGTGGYWEVYSSLLEIVTLQHYLEIKKIPYIFSCIDAGMLNNYERWEADESINVLYNQLDLTKWIFFPDKKGFFTWAKDNNFQFGTTHPLEQAHAAAAKHIKETYSELVNQSLQKN